MPEEDYVELSHIHASDDFPYPHVDAFVRDRITGKKIRKIGDGWRVE